MISAQPPTISVPMMASHKYTAGGGDHGSSGFGGFTGQHFEQCGSSGIPAECRGRGKAGGLEGGSTPG